MWKNSPFNTIIDFIALIAYFLQMFEVDDSEVKSFIEEYEKDLEKKANWILSQSDWTFVPKLKMPRKSAFCLNENSVWSVNMEIFDGYWVFCRYPII